MKLVKYENISFPYHSHNYYDDRLTSEQIKNYVFKDLHRYNGNHMEGHGEAIYKVYEVNIKTHEDIKSNIETYKKEIKRLQETILGYLEELSKLDKDLEKEYVETLLFTEKIGYLPTDEELVKDGWTLEQIKNRSGKS